MDHRPEFNEMMENVKKIDYNHEINGKLGLWNIEISNKIQCFVVNNAKILYNIFVFIDIGNSKNKYVLLNAT